MNSLGEDFFSQIVDVRFCYGSLVFSEVADTDLEYFGTLTELRRLDLWNSHVTDAGLAHVKGLTQLRWLYLDCTEVTDAGLKHLEGLSNLEFLSVGNTKVSLQALQELCRKLPKMEVDYYDPMTGQLRWSQKTPRAMSGG
jgi:hypothetical protein